MAEPAAPRGRKRSKPLDLSTAVAGSSIEERRKAALQNYEDVREFYQSETTRYARWHLFLTGVTLAGSALTPVLLLANWPSHPHSMQIVQALPAAIGGLAAAFNASQRYRQEWADNYYALSALMNEYQRFRVRTSPEYSNEATAVDNFQNRISAISMSEVAEWRTSTKSSQEPEKTASKAAGEG